MISLANFFRKVIKKPVLRFVLCLNIVLILLNVYFYSHAPVNKEFIMFKGQTVKVRGVNAKIKLKEIVTTKEGEPCWEGYCPDHGVFEVISGGQKYNQAEEVFIKDNVYELWSDSASYNMKFAKVIFRDSGKSCVINGAVDGDKGKTCLLVTARELDGQSREKFCHVISPNKEIRDRCFEELAEETKNKKFCENVTSPIGICGDDAFLKECEVILEKNKIDLCKNTKREGACYKYMAEKTGKGIKVCDEVERENVCRELLKNDFQ